MLNAVDYLNPLFLYVFGCEIRSFEGLWILTCLSMVSSVLSILCLKVAVNSDRDERRMK